jgi:hypothetical protein
MKKIIFGIALFLIITGLQAQALLKSGFNLVEDPGYFSETLYGNGIVDLVVQNDSTIWAATGYGLSKAIIHSTGSVEWKSFSQKDYLGKGGVSAMALKGDSVLWIATAFDTVAQGSELPAGSGLSYTKDGGKTWNHVPQPVDSRYEENYSPTTTVVQNLTYDITFIGNRVWIASFGGGLRYSDDNGLTWQLATTDGLPFSSSAHLNHRAFSLLSVGDSVLWVGTAEGISKSVDNGATWERYKFSRTDSATISGNFVVALAWQEAQHTVWASTIQAQDTAEYRALSRSSDGGQTWERLLGSDNLFAHNLAFDGNTVFAPSDLGLYYSDDNGATWQIITRLADAASGNEILQNEYYSAAVMPRAGETLVWLGSSDGLAYQDVTNGLGTNDWHIIRSFVSPALRPKPQVYAYPSPFSPSRHLYIRFELGEGKMLDEPIKIYDFAMDPVATVPMEDTLKPKWDGTMNSGGVVASGVYFFRAKVGGHVTWGKIVIIN